MKEKNFLLRAANSINDNWVECHSDYYQSRTEYSCIFCDANKLEVWDDDPLPDLNKAFPHRSDCIVFEARRVIVEQIKLEHKGEDDGDG